MVKEKDFDFSTPEGIVDFLVKSTGSIMGDIDRLFECKGLGGCPIERIGGFAYFLVCSAISSAEKDIKSPFSCINVYKVAICKDHAVKAESISFIRDYYEKSRLYYEVVARKDPESLDYYFRLSEAFFDIAFDRTVQNEKLRLDLVKAIAEKIQKNQPDFICAIRQLFSQNSA